MEYAKEYSLAFDTIMPLIKEKHFNEPSLSDKKMIAILYNDINEGLIKSYNNVKIDMFKTVKKDNLIYPSPSNFKSPEIDNIIKKTLISQTSFSCNLLDKKINVVFSIMKDDLININYLIKSMQLIYSWLYVCSKYSKTNCCKELNINIYFTSFKKGFPNSNLTTLGPENVNSAYATQCQPISHIVIFRKEEWFKVFIHECGHTFGFEPSELSEVYLSNAIKKYISIKSCIRISEAYVETWARIINVFYSAIMNSSSYADFINILKFTIKIESLFSIMQAYRVLSFMKMPYYNIIDISKHNECKFYKENTNVFAYYVLCAAFMNKPFNFINWCDNYNSNCLQFDNNNVLVFEKYIKQCLYDKSYEEFMLKFQNVANRKFGLRFTITELSKDEIIYIVN